MAFLSNIRGFNVCLEHFSVPDGDRGEFMEFEDLCTACSRKSELLLAEGGWGGEPETANRTECGGDEQVR